MSDIAITFTILIVAVGLFVWNRVPVAVVALGVALALFYTGVLDAGAAFAGLGDPVVIFIATLFVISAGLEAAGVTTWAGQMLIRRAGASHTRLLVLVMLVCVLFTAAMSFIGAVAALLPVAVVAAMRVGLPISRIAMPLAFSASAGGLMTLVGSPVNVLMSNAAEYAGVGGFGFFEFAAAGIPLVAGTMAIIVLLGRYLLPARNGEALPADFSRHARTLVEQYRIADGLLRLRVREASPYIGITRSALSLDDYPGLTLISIQSGGSRGARERTTIGEGDLILVRGAAEPAGRLAADKHLAPYTDGVGDDVASALFNRESGLAEVVIPPRSNLIGRTVFPGMVTRDGELIVLAVQRRGEDQGAQPTALAAGDHVLLQGTWQGLDRKLADPEVLFVDSPDLVRRQAVALGRGAKRAIAILALLILLLASGLVPSVVAGVTCACAMVLLGVITMPQAYRGIDWTTLILLGGMIPLSTAMTTSGAADMMAEHLLALVGEAGPRALLGGLFVLTLVLGQLISNTATALIIAPIAVAASVELGISPRPVLMSIAVAAAASFFTPVATPPNVMVMGPGGYRFGDYWKLGLPCAIWFGVVAVFLVPLWWRF
ncbi:MAG: SLC13 family permease [Burkholderiales bacterium]